MFQNVQLGGGLHHQSGDKGVEGDVNNGTDDDRDYLMAEGNRVAQQRFVALEGEPGVKGQSSSGYVFHEGPTYLTENSDSHEQSIAESV